MYIANVVLVPVGFVYYWILTFLAEKIPEAFPVRVRIDDSELRLPTTLYDGGRSQLRSEEVLSYLRGVDRWASDEKVLAIVDDDAYALGTNFVFGQAEIGGKFGAVYLARLRPEFYKGDEGEGLFLLRVLKETSHELGHLLGLRHCTTPRCVMKFSLSISHVDRKDWKPCQVCLSKLGVSNAKGKL